MATSIDWTKASPTTQLHEEYLHTNDCLKQLEAVKGDDEGDAERARARLEGFGVNLTLLDNDSDGRVQNMIAEAVRGDAVSRKNVLAMFRNPDFKKRAGSSPATTQRSASSTSSAPQASTASSATAGTATPASASTRAPSTASGSAPSQGSHDASPGDTQDNVADATSSSSQQAASGANEDSGDSVTNATPNEAPQGATSNGASTANVGAGAPNLNAASQGASSSNNAPSRGGGIAATRGRGGGPGRGGGAAAALAQSVKDGLFADRGGRGGGRGRGGRGGGGRGGGQDNDGDSDLTAAQREKIALDEMNNAPALATTLHSPAAKQQSSAAWSQGAPPSLQADAQRPSYNAQVKKSTEKQGDANFRFCSTISPAVLAKIDVGTGSIPYTPVGVLPAQLFKNGDVSRNTFVLSIHAAFDTAEGILKCDMGFRKEWLLHAQQIFVLWEGAHTRNVIVAGVGATVVEGNVETRTQYIDVESAEPVPFEKRKGYLSEEHCLVQTSFDMLRVLGDFSVKESQENNRPVHVETRRALTKEGDRAIYEAESTHTPDPQHALFMTMFALTCKSQAQHRARIRFRLPNRENGKVPDSFRSSMYQVGISLQATLGAQVLMMGNDMIVWTPTLWDRNMKSAVEKMAIVKSCYTEERIVGTMPKISARASCAEVASVVRPVAEDVTHAWGTVVDGLASDGDWAKLLEEIGGIGEQANPFRCRFTIPIAKWAALTTERYCTRGWCRLSLNQPMQMVV
jgi:hypothetical protein